MAGYEHWWAFGLLSVVAGKMLFDARRRQEQGPQAQSDPTRGLTMVTLSLATSIDAFAVGLSVALLGVSIWVTALVAGFVAGGLTVVGIHFGSRLGPRWEHYAELAGGGVLLAIAFVTLLRPWGR